MYNAAMILNDRFLQQHGSKIFTPFTPESIRKNESNEPVLSYGTGSFGYDLRLGDTFKKPREGRLLDPKNPSEDDWEHFTAQEPFVLEAGEIVLGHSYEHVAVPDDCMIVCYTKSSYARVGGFANVTPFEAGWKGIVTIEIANLGKKNPIVVYPLEGIVQLLLFKGERPVCTYAERPCGGKYQNQKGVTLATA